MGPVTVIESWEIPLLEVSALAARGAEVLAVGDRQWAVGVMAVEPGAAVPKRPIEVVAALADGGVPTAGQSGFEGVATDGAGRVLVLQEGPSKVLVLDAAMAKLEHVVTLHVAPDYPDIGVGWASEDNARGEGLLLLEDGHILVAKQHTPVRLIEFGPAGADPRGYVPGDALPAGKPFKLAPGAASTLEVLATWSLDASPAVESINDLAVGPDGRLHFVSSRSRCIGWLEAGLKRGASSVAAATAALPEELFEEHDDDKAEGLVFVDELGWLLGVDHDRPAANLHRLTLSNAARVTLELDGTSSDLKTKPEHCAVDAATLAALHSEPGRQVLIELDAGDAALFTVSERAGGAQPVARVGTGGLARFDGATTPSRAKLETAFTGGTANARLSEELRNARARGLAILAPHGGMIEPFTDDEAVLAFEALKQLDKPVAAWIARGFHPKGAHERWHITSTDISEHSFPKLGALLRPGPRFAHAIAFHGHGGTEVIVGGGVLGAEHAELKEALRARIDRALPPSVKVKVLTTGELAGASPANIVNRVTTHGNGIQIEQPFGVRNDAAQRAAIADAVVETYADLI